jgi:type I restriction enzyme S subunit
MRNDTGHHDQQAGWVEKPLFECATVQTGVSKGRKLNHEELISVPYLRVANVQDGYLDLHEIKEIQIRPQEKTRYTLQPGDVLLTEGGDFDKLGRGFVWNGEIADCIHQNHVFAVRVDQTKLDPHFFAYQAQSPYGKQYFLSVAHKTTNLACINTTKLKAFPVLLPPLTEQKKIAGILSTLQRAIEAQERIIQTTTELKQALMQKLFSEGSRGEAQKETEIGLMPESWEVVELVSILREPLRNGHSAKAISDENGIRTLTLTAVTQQDFSLENTKVTCADPQRVREMWLKPGDIFIERANTAEYVGLAALYEGVEDFAIFPDLLIRIRVDNTKMRPKVLIEWLLAETCRRYYKKNARSTAGNFPKIDQGTVEKTMIPVPSPEEQKEMEDVFRTLDDKLREHASHKSALQDLFDTLLHQVMTAEICVEGLAFPDQTISINP